MTTYKHHTDWVDLPPEELIATLLAALTKARDERDEARKARAERDEATEQLRQAKAEKLQAVKVLVGVNHD